MGLWTRKKTGYGGLIARCAPGTHEAAVSLLQQRGVPVRGVLDLASGSGALLARLRDEGFDDFQAIDLNRDGFALSGVTFRTLDLNLDFDRAFDRRFNLVTAIEIVEHLDNPRHFLRAVHALLEDDGCLLISTPNIAHWIGRILFALTGDLWRFGASQYHYQRHISPTTETQMKLMLKEIGFDIIAVTRAGSFQGPMQRAILFPAICIFRALWGKRAFGEVVIYLARKCDPDRTSPGSNSHYLVHRNDSSADSHARSPAIV